MTEAQFQTRFTTWAKHNHSETAAFELKVCNGPSLPFASVKEHQVANLMSAKHRRLMYKIPDAGYDQKPFDCFMLSGCPAYVVVLFHERRGDNEFHMIDVDRYVEEMGKSERKSFTKEQARSWSYATGWLK